MTDGARRRPSLGLRARFVLAGALLVATTVASGVYSAVTFARLGRSVGEALRDTEETTNASTALATALEREDDALLLTLAGDPDRARVELERGRTAVASTLAVLDALLVTPAERESSGLLKGEVDAYHAAGDALVRGPRGPDARETYHHGINPLLRRAVTDVSRIRLQHLQAAQQLAAWARDETRSATSVAVSISLAALALSIVVALHLAKVVVWPLRELSGEVEAIRRGEFERRIELPNEDEIGRLADGINRMAGELAEFRRTNVAEVVRAKETLEATIAALPDAVVVVDPDGKIASMNVAAMRLAGAMHGSAPQAIADLPLPEEAVGAIRRALDAGQPAAPPGDLSGAVAVTVSGQPRKLLPRIVPIAAPHEPARGAVLVLYDVTELVRLDEMRIELVAVASHELRTPLTTLRMTLLLLHEGAKALTPRQQDVLATALVGVEQLATTVDEFLDLTRIEAGQLRLVEDTVDVGSLVGQAAGAVRARLEETGVALRVNVANELPAVWGDAARLRAVLSNVLGNAAKYTPAGGAVEVRAERTPDGADEGVILSVTDTGPGVPAEYRDRVFEKFFRVEHQRPGGDAGVRGSGIGLYLARQIVAAHGGTIRCEAGEAGKGTRIAITLRTEHAAAAPS